MVNQELLHEYSNNIRILKRQCADAGINEDEFRKLYFESLKSLEKPQSTIRNPISKYITRNKISLLLVITVIYITYNYKLIYSNLQEYIYPGLRLLRRISVPFISLFPSLTDLYHETCLIQNPFFTVVDMDCWPCSTVNNVRDIYDIEADNQQHNTPFMYQTQQSVINMETLKEFYMRNKEQFNKEAPKILCNNNYYIYPDDMFKRQQSTEEKNLYIWKFNNMNMARLLRQAIPRPKVVPKFGQSTERFLIVDASQNSFHIPDTECNYSFLLSLSGSRIVDLIPAEECKHQCKSLRIELKETYLLWYNWWYWRPVVQPSLGNDTLIAHIGSYC